MELLIKRRMCQTVLYLLHFLVLFTRESISQPGFCRQDKPVVRFCTYNGLTNLTDVIIDTISVPRYQENVCECTVFAYIPGVLFTFSYYDREVPRNMLFKINDVLLTTVENRQVWSDRAKLLLLTTKNYTTEGTCLIISTDDSIRFNISCSSGLIRIMSTNLVTDKPTSVKQGGMISETPEESTTTQTTGLSETEHIPVAKITVIVVPTVIGVLLVLAATVILFVYIKRHRLTTETKLHGHDHQQQLSVLGTEQGQGHQSNAKNEDRGHEIPVNAYERLNMYVNSSLAGEMYQQLDVDKSEEYQKMPNVKRNAGNQDRHFTKQIDLQEPDHERTQSKAESLKGQGRGQENDVNGGERDLEISSNVYERLNLYVNDNLAGEMYEQLAADQTRDYQKKHIPCNEDRPNHMTNANEITHAVYTKTLLQNDE